MSTKASPSANVCTYCSKECKSTDSRPHPTSKSRERIHNKCRLKMVVSGKKAPAEEGEAKKAPAISNHALQFNDASVAERLARDELELKQTSKPSKADKQDNNSAQFFFDLKAGTVTNEKRRYLRHGKLTDFVARYDQDGFKEEAIGRSYDAAGNDLTVLQDEADLALQERLPKCAKQKLTNEQQSVKRKHELVRGRKDDGAPEKRLASQKHKCWFCLSSSGADKELVISIGEHCYLALAKGGLTDDHLLIIPLEHICSIRSDCNSEELLRELEYLKESLVDFFGSQSKAVVFFERNVKSFHWQLQVVPIPMDKFNTIEDTLRRISLKHYKKTSFAPPTKQYSLCDIVPTEATPYFRWESRSIHSSSDLIDLVTLIDVDDVDFPIQFGRMVLTDEEILDCPDKVDWKTCDKSCNDYQKLVRPLKESIGHLFDRVRASERRSSK